MVALYLELHGVGQVITCVVSTASRTKCAKTQLLNPVLP
jgi:hypothetical protein